MWSGSGVTDDDQHSLPTFFDLLSGPRFSLSVAFQWAGWKVLHPVDFALGPEFDLTSVSTQHAVANVLPSVSLYSCAMDCSTKSRIREIPLAGKSAPRPLRSEDHPRGCPGLPAGLQSRVDSDTCSPASHAYSLQGSIFLSQQEGWRILDYDACCLFASRRKRQRIVNDIQELCSLPTLTCGHRTKWQAFP